MNRNSGKVWFQFYVNLYAFLIASFIGKYHKGKRVKGQWVFGGVERDTGKCFLEPVEARSEIVLLSLIKDWILPGTTIISGCWKAYHNIE